MSGEERDRTYKPTKKAEQKDRTVQRQSGRRNTRRVDYTEVEVISSGCESEETVIESESGIGSVKLEPG